MYKIKDFDYDLWKDADGKCYARVRNTGEVCEINGDTMKLLRREEKRIYRELDLKKSLDSDNINDKTKASIMFPLSFEATDYENNDDSSWLQSNESLEEEQDAKDLEERFMKLLTGYQKEVFLFVLKNGESQIDFAKRKGVTSQSVRNVIAVRMKMANGEFSITTAPYGYMVENNNLVPVPELKPAIERIFKTYLSGKGMGIIAEELNSERYMDREWNLSAVKYILSNEKYVGDSLLQKTYTPQMFPLKNRPNNGEVDKYYVSNTHEPLIDRDLFNAVQEKLKQNKLDRSSYEANRITNFTQKIRCGDCGCAFKRKIQSGEAYWVCSSNGIAGRHCKTQNVKEDDLRKSFVRLFNRLKLYEFETVASALNQLVSLKAKISGQSTAISDIDIEIAATCEKNCMLAKLKARNIVDDVSYMEQTSALQKRLTELRSRRIKLLNEDEDEKSIERLRTLKNELDEYDGYMLLFDKDVFESMVQNIFVSDDDCVTYELKCRLKLKERI